MADQGSGDHRCATKRIIIVKPLGKLALILSCAAMLGAAPAPSAIRVPWGKHVLLDGRISAGEWKDAKEIAASPNVRIYLKRSGAYLYVGVKPAAAASFGVDLYLDSGEGAVQNLHASAKLAERRGNEGAWPEWQWWNNKDWTANVARGQVFEEKNFLTDEAKEFQISMKKLMQGTVYMSLDLHDEHGTQKVPKDGFERNLRYWIALRL